jgi:hypothetical protein
MLHVYPHQIWIFILRFWSDQPPHFEGLWFSWCVYFSLIVHHLEDIKVWNFRGLKKMKMFKVIFIKFESLEVIYFPIFKCSDVRGVFFLPKNVRFGRYKRFKVLRLHGCFNLITLFYFGIWSDLPHIPFSNVLILMVCWHFLNCSSFGRYERFDFGMVSWFFKFKQNLKLWRWPTPLFSKSYHDNAVFIFI